MDIYNLKKWFVGCILCMSVSFYSSLLAITHVAGVDDPYYIFSRATANLWNGKYQSAHTQLESLLGLKNKIDKREEFELLVNLEKAVTFDQLDNVLKADESLHAAWKSLMPYLFRGHFNEDFDDCIKIITFMSILQGKLKSKILSDKFHSVLEGARQYCSIARTSFQGMQADIIFVNDVSYDQITMFLCKSWIERCKQFLLNCVEIIESTLQLATVVMGGYYMLNLFHERYLIERDLIIAERARLGLPRL